MGWRNDLSDLFLLFQFLVGPLRFLLSTTLCYPTYCLSILCCPNCLLQRSDQSCCPICTKNHIVWTIWYKQCKYDDKIDLTIKFTIWTWQDYQTRIRIAQSARLKKIIFDDAKHHPGKIRPSKFIDEREEGQLDRFWTRKLGNPIKHGKKNIVMIVAYTIMCTYIGFGSPPLQKLLGKLRAYPLKFVAKTSKASLH